MSKSWIQAAIAVCILAAGPSAAGQSIYLSSGTTDGDDVVVQSAVRDLQALLRAATGGKWALVSTSSVPRNAAGVVVGRSDDLPDCGAAWPFGLETPTNDGYILHSVNRRLVTVAAPTSIGVRNGVYALLERLGYGFYLGGTTWPEVRVRWSDLDTVSESRSPAFQVRGVLAWYNFLNSPTAWEPADHRAFVDALARMRMTFVGFHAYDSEPFGAYDQDGALVGGEPLANTLRPTWGAKAMATDEFYGGTARYFAREAFGASSSLIEDREASIRTAKAELADALAYAKARGLTTCLGFEVHGDPTDPARQDAFERRLIQLLQDYPMLDCVWIWEPEAQAVYPVDAPSARSPWGSAQARWDAAFSDIEDARRRGEAVRMALYAQHAQRVVEAVRPSVRLVVSGWGGDEWLRFTDFFPGLDSILSEQVAFAALDNIRVTPTVSEAYGKLSPRRSRWPIIWFEFDGDQWMPQPNLEATAGACRDALAKGCQGILGIHWRTRAVEESAGYVSRFAWDPELTVDAYVDRYAAHRFGSTAAKTMAPVLRRLQALGYRWVGGSGQNECAPFSWRLGEEAKVGELRSIAAQLRPAETVITDVTSMLPPLPMLPGIPVVSEILHGPTGPASSDRYGKAEQDLRSQIDFVLAFEDVARKLAPGGRLDQLLEEGDRSEAIRYVRQSGLAQMLHLYASRVENKGELGVLATMNAKLWADLRGRLQPDDQELVDLCSLPDSLRIATGMLLLPDRVILPTATDRAVSVELRMRRQGQSRETTHVLQPMGRSSYALDFAGVATEPGGYEYAIVVKTATGELMRSPSTYPQHHLLHVAQGPAVVGEPQPAPTAAPGQAADLQVRPTPERHAVLLDWTAAAGETYSVYRDGQLLGRTANGWFEDMTPRSETTHEYAVVSRRVGSEQTTAASVTVTTPSYPVPSAPARVDATSRAGRITIAWDSDAPNAERYVVTKLGSDQSPIASYAVPAAYGRRLEYTDADVTVRKSYAYTVAAVAPDGRTGPPSKKIGIMAAPTPLTPLLELTFESDSFLQGLTQLAQNALALGGSGWAELPSQPDWDPKSELTLSLWVKLDDLEGMPVLLCKGAWQQAGYFLQLYQGTLRFYLAGVDTLDAGRPEPTVWQHVAATYGAGEMRIYLNGELAGAKPVEGLPIPSPTPLLLGRYGQNEDIYFVRGVLDDVAVYDLCLTPAEIQAIFTRQSPGS